jgi:hypothetical protein
MVLCLVDAHQVDIHTHVMVLFLVNADQVDFHIDLPPVVWWANGDCPSLFTSGSLLRDTDFSECYF